MKQKTNWAIDPAHSEIGFKVKHMMFTNVSGKLTKYNAIIETAGDEFAGSVIDFSADIDSLTTGSSDRDAHLLGPDFFDAQAFPKINFVATEFEKLDDGDFMLTGDLTMHGISKPVKLAVEFGGLLKDPYGNIKAAFAISGKINRKDWGLTWNAALETGGVLVSDDVKIFGDIQLLRA